jgi:iduronate 2-sulfatase
MSVPPSRFRRFACFALCLISISFALAADERPNVLLIVCDDLNDVIGHMGGHPQGSTPHIDGLAQTGSSFPRAYSNNPICAPSRSSFMTGIYPHTSRNYAFDKWYENTVLANSKTMMQYFAENGYAVAGTGKIMHHHRAGEWQEFGIKGNQGPFAWDGTEAVGHPSVPEPFRSVGLLDGSFGSLADVPFGGVDGKGWSYFSWKYDPFYYNSDEDRSLMPDEINAEWAANRISGHAQAKASDPDTGPLFLAVGFVNPHTPMFAPQKYFDMFPLETLQLPEILEGDKADTFYKDLFPSTVKGIKMYEELIASYPTPEEGLRHFVQAYLACTAFVDAQVGTVLEALETHGMADNTIVILTSDHGWNLGEKDHLYKNSPWEESGRVPLLIRAPGVSQPGGQPGAPVSLIDLYPTLVDLCGLTGDTRKNDQGRPLDGFSLRPFLENPSTRDWDGPDVALTMVHSNASTKPPEVGDDPRYEHYSLRSEHFRYVRYNDLSEELYDHRVDPFEWNNVADSPEHAQTIEAFREKFDAFLPVDEPQDMGNVISVNVSVEPTGDTAIDGAEVFGVPDLDTVLGNWNNINVDTPALTWANGGSSSVNCTLLYQGNFNYFGAGYRNTPLNYGTPHYAGTSDNPGTGISFQNLRANFPDGYWAIAYMGGFIANTGAVVTDGSTRFYYQTYDPAPPSLGVDNLVQTMVTTDPGDGLAPFAQYAVFGSPEAPLTNDQAFFSVDTVYGGGVMLGGVQLISASPSATTWAGYEIFQPGYVDAGSGFLSWVWVGEDGRGISDWMFPASLGQWVYLPEAFVTAGSGAWFYIYDTASLSPVDQRDSWFFSQALQSWSYSTSPAVNSGSGWVYVMDLSV